MLKMAKDRRREQGRGRQHLQSRPYNKSDWRDKKKEHAKQTNGKNNSQSRNKGPIQKCTLRENQVGITEFTNADIPGFTGILKSRFSDFHVNEIDTEGHVLKLNDINVPKVEIQPVEPSVLEEWREKLSTVIDSKLWQEIADLAAAKYDSKTELKVDINVSNLTKEQRTQIHHLVKQLYKDKLISKTTSQPKQPEQQVAAAEELKIIRIIKPQPGRSDNRWNFPHEFVSFLVHKVNMDTSEVASMIANRLRCMNPSQVNYCGTKDKRAKTTQRFCIKRRTPEAIANAARGMNNVHIGNFEFRPETLKLGDLQGNYFRIALRHITHPREQIEFALQSLNERGFINYYGLQRFGNSASVPTHQVGVALLKHDYKLACELILKPRENDIEFMRAIREAWWENRDSAAAAAKFHGDNRKIEKKLLHGLAAYGENDYANALRRIPRNMLLLYPHAYQSLIFNRIASRRIKEFGLTVIRGDLIFVEDDNELQVKVPEEPVIPTDGEEIVEDIMESEGESLLEEESIFKRKVRPLTAEDIASGKYSLSDVVLPLPGYDITYPSNECAAWYEEMLAEEGLSSELLRHKEKTYALSGAYRKLLIKPNDLKWSFRRYKTHEDTLISSDWEKLKNIDETPEPAESDVHFMALLLEFTLPTSVYATMLLRELFKQDTSTASQMQLEQEQISQNQTKDTSMIQGEAQSQPN